MNRKELLTVFTLNGGVITLFAKPPNTPSPFCLGEWIYKRGRKDLYFLEEMSLINPFLELRERESTLFAAGGITRSLLRCAGPPDPALYYLCRAYFLHLSRSEKPETLVASFRLKLLIHEGICTLNRNCSTCGAPTRALYLGECFCSLHAPRASIELSSEELDLLFALGSAGKFSELKLLDVSRDMQEKIERTERDSNP